MSFKRAHLIKVGVMVATYNLADAGANRQYILQRLHSLLATAEKRSTAGATAKFVKYSAQDFAFIAK